MSRQEFTVTLETTDRGVVRLIMPFDPTAVWGKKARHAIQGSVNGVPFAGTLGARSGKYFVPLNKELRERAGIAPGDTVRVTVEPADAAAPPLPSLPEDLAKALAKKPKARAFLDGLSPFYRNSYVKWIEEAKRPETRRERVQTTVERLGQQKKQR
jgi:hypothetical protein